MQYTHKQTLQGWTAAFSETKEGSWLTSFNWKSIPVDWSDRCNASNGILGMYSMGHIWLMEAPFALDMIFPTYIHELYHRWQWINNPLRYLLGKAIRPIIERPADAMTKKAENFIDQME